MGEAPRKHPEVLGDYKIIRLIGKGGMATVYEAEQISLKRRVALKVLPGHLSLHDEAVKRFRREAEAGGRQSHPGIVAIFGVGEHEGYHYIAEELVEGETSLADLLDEYRHEKALPLGYYQQGAQLIMEVAGALQHAHEAGVIHRDVKPSNVLITREGKPKVSDFGLAKVEDALALSRTGEFIGTPFYMSPEQAMSRRIGIDHRTDIYSLGVSLYELLTLKRPFDGKTSQEVLKKIIFFEPKNPSKLNARVPRDLSTICLKAMEKNPLQRYQTMAELKEDLNRYLHGEVILAKPAGLGVRIGKWIKRRPAAATAAGVLIVAALAIVLNWCWSLKEVVIERNKVLAINEFLEEMLLSPDPDRDGREVRVVEIIDKAAAGVDGAFPDQPEIEAAIRNLLGNTYRALGMYDAADKQQQASFELRRQKLGEDHMDTIRSKHDQAVALWYQARYAEAEPLFEEVVTAWRDQLGEEHSDTLAAMNNLAGARHRLGMLGEAEAMYRQVLEAHRRLHGNEDEGALLAMNNIALIKMNAGELVEAEQLFNRVLEVRLQNLGAEHTNTLHSKANLAVLYNHQEKYDEAETLLREVLETQMTQLGDEHRDTLSTQSNLVNLLIDKEELDEAETICRQLLDGRRRAYGEESPITLAAYNKLGRLLILREQFTEAQELLEEPVLIVQRDLPKHHRERILMHILCGKCLTEQSEFQLAEPHMLAYHEGMRDLEGADHPDTLKAVQDLIDFYENWGNQPKADMYRQMLSELEGEAGE
jgi:tetratricopeptide (TPR) repeat protein